MAFGAVAAVAVTLVWTASALACAVPEFLGDYPGNEELNWSENVQGVAHDEGHWFFTNQDSLIKLPADFPLDEDPDFDHPTQDLRRRQLDDDAYDQLANRGIDHFGDIDYYGGFIFAPLETPQLDVGGVIYQLARSWIAIFDPSDLSVVSLTELTDDQGEKAGWLAIDPWTGFLYSSPSHVSTRIYRYKIDRAKLKDTSNIDQSLEFDTFVDLRESNGDPLRQNGDDPSNRGLRHMQGGTFTPWGDLVLINGYIDDPPGHDRGGVHIFRPVGASRQATEFRLVAESVNEKGLGGFKFAYEPAFSFEEFTSDNDEEPEGIDWWTRGPSSGPAFAQGHLHAQMVDNTQLANGESNPDDLYFKHYSVDYSCLPDWDGDGLATDSEVDVRTTDPLNPDTDGDGLSDGSEVKHGSDPKNADSDGDGTSDGDEDSDGDGLTDGAEVNTHGTDPKDADSDDDDLSDGAEVDAHGTDPNDADSDDDGFSDGFEVAHGTNPLSGDSDGDGIPDGQDVEFVQNAISALPASAFKPPGGGTRTSMLAMLDDVESSLVRGRTDDAIRLLRTLRTRVDGCGTAPARDDWIVDCAAQVEIRDLIDKLLANLGA